MTLSIEQTSAIRMSLLTRRDWLIDFIARNKQFYSVWKAELDTIEELIGISYESGTMEINK